ncbi:hypothetical protein ACFW6F_05055 [Streptomyces sp. NPDC058746]|uniref:hypothetical protein n=1 Tax=Streptomyces sp. NPDC058746 TaxID=3346622 RepID=UPI00367E56E1
MSWNQPAAVPPPPSEAGTTLRERAVLALLALLPVLFLAKFLLLATDRGGRCFVNDIGCAPFPGGVFLALLGAAVSAAVLVGTATVRAGRIALRVQLVLEAAAVGIVLAFP